MLRHQRLGLLLHGDQPVHRPQQVMVRRLPVFELRKVNAFQPLQQGEFADRVTRPVDDQHSDHLRRGEGRLAIDARGDQRLGHTETIPDGSDRMDMAEILDGAESRCGGGRGDVFSLRTAQTDDQLFDLCFSQTVHSAQVRENAGAWGVPLGRIPERFDDLDVPVDLLPALLLEGPDEHTTSIPYYPLMSSKILRIYILHTGRGYAGNSTHIPSVILKSGGSGCRTQAGWIRSMESKIAWQEDCEDPQLYLRKTGFTGRPLRYFPIPSSRAFR